MVFRFPQNHLIPHGTTIQSALSATPADFRPMPDVIDSYEVFQYFGVH